MTKTAQAARDARAELELDVRQMRALGVLEWKDIVLGEDPRKPGPARDREPRETPEEMMHRTLFASSSIRPKFAPREVRPSAIPRAVVARREGAKAAAHGERSKSRP